MREICFKIKTKPKETQRCRHIEQGYDSTAVIGPRMYHNHYTVLIVTSPSELLLHRIEIITILFFTKLY